MKKFALYIIITTCFLFKFFLSQAQISNYIPQQNGTIEASFLLDKVESEAQSIIFNILTIRNTSNSPFDGKISISVPITWAVIGETSYNIQIESLDSLNIPVRIAISRNALGDIGYSVVGTVSDLDGKTIKSAYTFVTIPRHTAFSSKIGKKLTYLPKDQDKIDFEYILNNEGNVNELIHLEVITSSNFSVEGSDEYSPYIAEYSLLPNSDTTISLAITKNNIIDINSYSSIQISTSSIDTSYNQTFWLKILDNILCI